MGTDGHRRRTCPTNRINGRARCTFTNEEGVYLRIGQWWWALFEDSMKEAGNEERAIAIANGRYHQGVPAITVIIDGGWSKRSHKHSYNAKSGVGIINRKETKKIGVQNKYCSVCNKAAGGTPPKHDCFKTGANPHQQWKLT